MHNVFSYIILTIAFFYIDLSGQKTTELKKLKEKQEKEIELTEELIKETRNKKEVSISNLTILQKKINIRNDFIEKLNSEVNTINNRIQENNSLLNKLSYNKKKLVEEYGSIIYTMYKYRKKINFFMYLLASESFNQAYKRIKYLQMYTFYRHKQKDMIDAHEKVIKRKNEELELAKLSKIRLLNEREKEKMLLAKDREDEKSIIKILKRKESTLLKELEEKRVANEKITREIEKIIEAERSKNKNKSIYENLTLNEKILSGEFAKNKGLLPWPTGHGVITGKFGMQPHPVLKDVKVRNDGIYISTIKNEEARAVFEGVVTKVFSFQGSNFTVIIKHGNYYSLYNNLNVVYVKEGDNIKTKQRIGRIYTDEKKNETILQFQIWKEREKNDPELWLSR